MIEELENLKAAGRVQAALSESDKIREGESLWIIGLPVPASEGHIGLSTGEGQSVILNESSILEVKKDGDRYLVRVKAGTAALVRFEAVTTLRKPDCSCSDTPTPSTIEQKRNPFGGIVLGRKCTVDLFCEVYIDKAGNPRNVCVAGLVCTDITVPYGGPIIIEPR